MDIGADVASQYPSAAVPLQDVVCIATGSDDDLLRRWLTSLAAAGIPARVQTITVREAGREARRVYLLYVHAADEERASRIVSPPEDLPIFPLAHLRHVSW